MFTQLVLYLICLLLIIVVLYLNYSKTKRHSRGLKILPSIMGIPIFGILFQVKCPLYMYFTNLRQQHGSIFKVRLGMRDLIVMNDYVTITKTIKNDGQTFSGRWSTRLTSAHNDDGLVFIDGDKWTTQRAFVLKVLRSFGVGRSQTEETVQSECSIFLEELERLTDQSTDISALIPLYTFNIISKFIINKRFSRDDPIFRHMEQALNTVIRNRDPLLLFHLMFPIFDNSDLVTKFTLWISSRKSMYAYIYDILDGERKDHAIKLTTKTYGDDLMDQFLSQQINDLEAHGTVKTFTDSQLIFLCYDLISAGLETTSAILGWALLIMSKYIDIQNRVYDEIIDIIGRDRIPTMEDKKELNFTQAVMDEILRLSTPAPLPIFRRTINDTVFEDYFIPANSLVALNLHACHTDSKVWKKPFEFYPEHFLVFTDENRMQYSPREELIPFGIGKRQCLGESLARMEYFIFFIRIFQNFHVRFAEPISDEKYREALIGQDGIVRHCSIRNFIFDKREIESTIVV